MAWENEFLYPLVLLIVGGGISLGLGTWLPNRWQNNKKKLEIKVEIVSIMDETIMVQIRKAVLLSAKGKKQLLKIQTAEIEKQTAEIKNQRVDTERQRAHVENISDWYMLKAKAIESKLGTYFPDTNLKGRWDSYALALTSLISALIIGMFEDDPDEDKKKIEPLLKGLSQYFKSSGNKAHGDLATKITSNYNTELVGKIIGAFYAEAESIKKDIMKAPIKIF
jgi:hypothetical protein